MRGTFTRFLRDESGPELVEWAVVTLILLAATVLVLRDIGTALRQAFLQILDQIAAAP